MKLNLGCEDKIIKGFENIDVVKREGVKVLDLNEIPYPYKDNSVDYILIEHTLMFLDNPLKVMEELYRICRDQTIIKVIVNHHSHFNNFTDLKQKCSFSYFTFGEDWVNHNINSKVKVLKRKLIFTRCHFKFLNYIFNPIINLFPTLYERFFSFILPCSSVLFVMERK